MPRGVAGGRWGNERGHGGNPRRALATPEDLPALRCHTKSPETPAGSENSNLASADGRCERTPPGTVGPAWYPYVFRLIVRRSFGVAEEWARRIMIRFPGV